MGAFPKAKTTRTCIGAIGPQGDTIPCEGPVQIPALGNKRRCDCCADIDQRNRSAKNSKAFNARKRAAAAGGGK